MLTLLAVRQAKAQDVPIFLLALVDKGHRVDISQAERNELRRDPATLAEVYRLGVRTACG
jgi:hypothetical protein